MSASVIFVTLQSLLSLLEGPEFPFIVPTFTDMQSFQENRKVMCFAYWNDKLTHQPLFTSLAVIRFAVTKLRGILGDAVCDKILSPEGLTDEERSQLRPFTLPAEKERKEPRDGHLFIIGVFPFEVHFKQQNQYVVFARECFLHEQRLHGREEALRSVLRNFPFVLDPKEPPFSYLGNEEDVDDKAPPDLVEVASTAGTRSTGGEVLSQKDIDSPRGSKSPEGNAPSPREDPLQPENAAVPPDNAAVPPPATVEDEQQPPDTQPHTITQQPPVTTERVEPAVPHAANTGAATSPAGPSTPTQSIIQAPNHEEVVQHETAAAGPQTRLQTARRGKGSRWRGTGKGKQPQQKRKRDTSPAVVVRTPGSQGTYAETTASQDSDVEMEPATREVVLRSSPSSSDTAPEELQERRETRLSGLAQEIVKCKLR